MEDTKPATVPVQVALARIISELPAIGKDDRMSGGGLNYNYRGIEAITSHVQPLLAKHGVIIIPQSRVVSLVPSPDQKPAWQDITLEIDWLIVGPDGSTLNARTVGVGRDASDKTATKAATQAYKYLLLHLFCISDKDDDADGIAYASANDEPVHDPIKDLFGRVKAAKDTPYAVVLKQAADENNMGLNEKALAADPRWAEIVTAILDDDMIGKTQEAANG